MAAFVQCCFAVFSFLSIGELSQEEGVSMIDACGFGDQMFAVAWVQGSAAEFALDSEKVTILGHGIDGWLTCCHTCSVSSVGTLTGIVSQPDFCDDTQTAARLQYSELLPTHIQRFCPMKRPSFFVCLRTSSAARIASLRDNISASRAPLHKGSRETSFYIVCPANRDAQGSLGSAGAPTNSSSLFSRSVSRE